jgi:O-antigen/teichoic acid export membrane protein
MAAVFQAGIDGFQRIDLRCYILMVSSLVYLGLCFALVPRFGLLGLAYAQLAQVSTLLIMASVVLRRLLPALPLVPHRFSRPLFRELFGYGLNVQVMAVGSLLLEPAAKGLISKYGGVDLTGYFEMANRMVIQLRQLINAAASALIPAVAHLEETERGAIQLVYKESYGGLFYIIWPALGLTLVSTPLFSELWIGYYQHSFVLYGILLSVGLYLGMLSSPAFYANLGAGTLRWNVVATFAMLAVTALPNLVTRGALGGTGMAVCYALAYVVGGAIILVGYHTQNHLGMWSMLPRDCLPTMVASLLGALAGLSLYGLGRRALGLPLLGVATLVIYFGLVFPPLWVHPLRKRLVGLLQREFGRKGDGDP